jgi:prepilin-type N-terminal cleavage/methylation domain-containing protein
MKPSQARSGFTLIELLVVIAIIAILAAILFPVFAQAREKARSASCLSNTKQLALGLTMYVQDYDETFPYWSWWYSSDPGGCPRNDGSAYAGGCNHWESFWFNASYPYVKNAQVYACPSANDRSTILQNAVWGWTNDGNNGGAANMIAHGFQPAMVNATVSYAYNQALAEGNITNGSPTTLAGINLPAQLMLTADCDTGETNSLPMPNAADPNDPLHHYIISRVAWPNVIPNCYATEDCGAALNNFGLGYPQQFPHPLSFYDSQARHTSGDNLSFTDGHSKWVRDSQITVDYQFGTWAQ